MSFLLCVNQGRIVEKDRGYEHLHMQDLMLLDLGNLEKYIQFVDIIGSRLLGSSR